MFKDILFYIYIKIKNNEIPKVEPIFRISQMLNYSRYSLYSMVPHVLISITIYIYDIRRPVKLM
jgi:hypothetical protein